MEAVADPPADTQAKAAEKSRQQLEDAARRESGPGTVDGGAPERDPSELVIDVGGQLSFAIGGKKPTSSSVRLTGGKIDVEGQFDKGATIVLRVEAVVRQVAFIDQADNKTGQVVGSERRHIARITGVSALD